MTILDKIKSVYYLFEDRYYGILDRIEKAIPVYKIVDPIDRVFPSFILCIIAIALIIAFLLWGFLGGGFGFLFTPATFQAKILVTDESRAKISGASLSIAFLDSELNAKTDANGEAKIEIPKEEIDAAITVEKTGYEKISEEDIALSAKTTAKITLKKLPPPPLKKYSVTIIDSETNGPVEEKVTAIFRCSGTGTAPQKAETTDSEITGIQPGENCGTLTGEFSAEGYETTSGFRFTKESDNARLYRKKGSVEITVRDTIGPVADAVVKLYRDGDNEVDSGITSSSGNYLFENAPPGNYIATATADDGRSDSTDSFDVEAGNTTSMEITLGAPIPKDEQKKIFILAKDSVSGQAIPSAKVIVFQGNTPFDNSETDNEGLYSRNADKTKAYSIAISKDGYITRAFSSAPLKNSDDTEPSIIQLTPITTNPQNYAELLIHVFDEENASIKNADVFVYGKNIPGLIINYPKSQTNDDGNAAVSRLEAGDYNIKATSGSQLGEATVAAETGKTTFVNIRLVTGEGSAEAKVKDASTSTNLMGAAVGYVNAETLATEAGCTTDAQGSCESDNIKAGTRIYARAAKDGFLPGLSSAVQITRNTKAAAAIDLDPETSYPADGNVIVEFKALCSDEACKSKASRIDESATAKFYYAKFNLILPAKNADYNEIFMHISAGPDSQAALPDAGWRAQIMNIAVPRYSSIEYSKCYDAAKPYETGAGCEVSTNAKQAVISWDKLERGVIPVIAKIKIEGGLPAGTEIEFRAIARAKVNRIDFESAAKKAIYRIGQISCATTGFGWGLDLRDSLGLQVEIPADGTTPIEIAKGTNYDLNYTLINCTGKDIASAKLEVKNTNAAGAIDTTHPLDLKAGANTGQGPLTVFEKPVFYKSEEVSSKNFGSIGIIPIAETSLTAVYGWLSESGTPISDITSYYSAPIRIVGEREFEFTGVPDSIVLTQPSIQITGAVLDKADGKNIQGALIKIKRTDSGALIPGYSRTTNSDGSFIMTIGTADLSGITKITLTAEKTGYKPLQKDITLSTTPGLEPINQNFKCIKINGEQVITDDLKAKEFPLPAVRTDRHSIATISTANCTAGMDIEIAAGEAPEAPVMSILGSGLTAMLTPNDTKKIAIGSSKGIQGEYPIILKARLQGSLARVPLATIYAQFSDSANETGCFSIQNNKFAYNLKTGSGDTGTIVNACAIAASSGKYPKAVITPHDTGAPATLESGSAPIEGAWSLNAGGVEQK
ncbi:MAG: carboxypeptidase regulatory-like domain-containing protein, partial [Candidatus ainarchaeum sp.]|nr:carboxypeptidase regulatory-like domain-containing protein [Candidatus ainarchaeum sp.]